MKKYSVGIVFCLVALYFNVVSAETAKISVYENRIMGGEQQLISEVFWTLGGKKYLYFEFKGRIRKDPPVLKTGKYSPVEFLKIIYPEAIVQENKNGITVIEDQKGNRDYPFTKEIDIPKTDDIILWLHQNAMPRYRVDFVAWPEKISFDGGKMTLRDLLVYVAERHSKYKICIVQPKNNFAMKAQRENVNFKDIPQGQLYWARFSEPLEDGLKFPAAPPLDGLNFLKVSLDVSVNEKENDRDNFFVNLPVSVENISGQELFFKDFQKDGVRISNGWDFSRKISQKSNANLRFSEYVNKNVEFKEPMPDSFSLAPGQKMTILLREHRDLTKPVLRAFKEKDEDPKRKREVCFNELYNAVLYFYDSKGVKYESHVEKNVEFINTYYVDRKQ